MTKRAWAWIVGAVAFLLGLVAVVFRSGALSKLAAQTEAEKHLAEERHARAEADAHRLRSEQHATYEARVKAEARAIEATQAAESAKQKRENLQALTSADLTSKARAELFNKHWAQRKQR